MPSHVVGGRRAVLEAIRAGAAREVLIARGSRSTPGLRDVLAAAAEAGTTIREVERDELDRLAPDHRGVAAHVRVPATIGERELAAWPFAEDALVVVLDGITDPQNLGAAARSAEAAGALLHLSHARVANIPRVLERLQGAGFTVVGLSEHAGRTVYEETCPVGRVAIVLGDEGEGLARLTREACDLLVRLPILGRVGSLNASASLAAALYAFALPARRDGRA